MRLFQILFFAAITLGCPIHLKAQKESNWPWYNNYDVKWYRIDIHANDTSTYIWGNTSLLVEIKDSFRDTLYLELGTNNTIDSILVSGKSNVFYRNGNLVAVSVPTSAKTMKNNLLLATIYYKGNYKGSGFFSSFSNKTDGEWNIPVTWTLSEPFGARSWFPCKQSLTDKADSAEICITVPKNTKAGSIGLLSGVVKKDTARVQYIWKTKYPTAYYLISLCVANYNEYSFYCPLGNGDSVFVQNYIYNRDGYLEANKSAIDETKSLIKLFSELFGVYPFKNEKYGHCVAPMGGGMEHQTMTTLSGFGFDLVSHELAHQWFGDWVTCASWQDIWLNEGFASYSEYLAIENLKSIEKATDWIRKSYDFIYFVPDGSVFVPKEEVDNENRIFSYSMSYKKGAALVHMLRSEINNDSLFFSILRDYFNEFGFKNAAAKDFFQLVNNKTGKNFDWFFDQWYYGKGYPVCYYFWTNKNNSLDIYAHQKSSAKEGKPFALNYEIKLSLENRDTTFSVFQNSTNTTYSIPHLSNLQNVSINPRYKTLMNIVAVNKVADLPTSDSLFSIHEGFSFGSTLSVEFKEKPEKAVQLQICDLEGKPVFDRKFKRQSKISIDTRWFDKGYYLVYVYYKNVKYVRIVNKNSY